MSRAKRGVGAVSRYHTHAMSSSVSSSPPPSIPAPRRRRRWPFVLGGVGVLLLVAFAVAAWRLDAFVNATIARQLPGLSKQIGRPITVGHVDVGLLGGLRVEVRDVMVGPDPVAPAGSVPPALTLRRARVQVALLRTLLSGGRHATVDDVTIEDLAVHAVLHADGRLDLQDIADRLQEGKPPEPDKPLDRDTIARVRGARLRKLRVSGVRLGFSDLADRARTASISQLAMNADEVSFQDAFTFALEAAILAPQKNFSVRADFGPAPERPDVLVPPPLRKMSVRLATTELAPLAPFIGALASGPAGQLLSASVAYTLEAQPGAAVEGGQGATQLQTSFTLTNARLRGGEPFGAALNASLSADAAVGDVDVRQLDLDLAGMKVHAGGKLFALKTKPRFENFVVTSEGLNFDRLRAIDPEAFAAANKGGLKASGPFTLGARAGGDVGAQAFEARLDFTSASFVVPDTFVKPAGTPLAVTVTGNAAGDSVTFDPLTFVVADWKLVAKGRVFDLGKPQPAFDVTAETTAPGIGGLVRLLPAAAKALPANRPVKGRIDLRAAAKGRPDDVVADIKLDIADIAVTAPGTRLGGKGRVEAHVESKGVSNDAKVLVDLTPLEAVYQDVLNKRAGAPFTINATVATRGTAAAAKTSAQGDVNLDGLRAGGTVNLQGPSGGAQRMDAELVIKELVLRKLLALLPGQKPGEVADLRLKARAVARGVANAPRTMHVELASLEASAGKSVLDGRFTLDDLEAPRIDMEAKSSYLDVDDFLPPTPKSAAKPKEPGAPAGKKGQGVPPDSPLAKAKGHVRLTVARGRASGIDFQDLRADLELVAGRLVARTLEVGAFGGRFSGAGTSLPLVGEDQPFDLKGKLTDLDIDQVIAHFGDGRGLMRGRLSAEVDLNGKGTEPADIQTTLNGLLSGKLVNAEFVPQDLLGPIAGPLAAAVQAPGFSTLLGSGAGKRVTTAADHQLGDLAGLARVANGALELTKPLAAKTPQGPLSLTGRVLLAGQADLGGTLTLTPTAATALTGGKVPITESVPVQLRITGPLRKPTITPTNLDVLAKTFARAYLQSEAGRAFQARLGAGANELLNRTGLGGKLPGGGGDSAATKAAAEAAAREQAAKNAAQAEAARAQAAAQAEAARKQAEEQARQQAEQARQNAKSKLKGIFGK